MKPEARTKARLLVHDGGKRHERPFQGQPGRTIVFTVKNQPVPRTLIERIFRLPSRSLVTIDIRHEGSDLFMSHGRLATGAECADLVEVADAE